MAAISISRERSPMCRMEKVDRRSEARKSGVEGLLGVTGMGAGNKTFEQKTAWLASMSL